MATVTLTIEDAWLTDVADPTSSVVAQFTERAATTELEGAVRFYAGGRARVITTANNRRSFPLTLEWLDDPTLAILETWRGRLLLLRDGAGRRIFGTFLALAVTDIWPEGIIRHTVALTFTELTYSDAV